MIVKLRRKNSRYSDLTPYQNYVVIGIEADDLRILNDQGRPYLYPSRLFKVVDPHEPSDWVTEFGNDDERYAYPPPLNDSGFFEDFFDDKKEAVAAFWQVVNQRLAAARAAVQSFRKKSLPPTKIRVGSRPAQQP
ncbi:MAG: hypothetical protein ACRENG_15065, partial [bacterium]